MASSRATPAIAPSRRRFGSRGRELEILRCVATGSANDAIAAQLGISVHTVRTHMHNVMGKLSVRSRAAAVIEARARFLLGPPDSDW